MTADELRRTAVLLAQRSRAEQGLPGTIEDLATLARLAQLFRPDGREGGSGGRGGLANGDRETRSGTRGKTA